MAARKKNGSSPAKSASRPVRVGVVQMSCSADPEENLEKAVERVREAAAKGAQVVCLQELYRSLYFCQKEDASLFDLAEPVPGPSTKTLGKIAKEKKIVLVVPIFEKRAKGVYHNSAALIGDDGETIGLYRKMHIPDDPLFYEKYYFAPGDLGFKVFPTKYGKIAVLICWDQWFPEGARLASLAGAEILFYPTAIGWLDSEPKDAKVGMRDAWRTIQRSHAIANGVFVGVANRVGHEGGLTFWGSSFVSDPFGRLLVDGDTKKEEILVAECDLAKIEHQRRNWPFLRDRRIDAYGGLLKRVLDE